MVKYLGEEVVPVEQSPYAAYKPEDWAMEWIERYGGYDGAHHKAWVLDQVARILKGTPVIITLAKWDNGQEEWRLNLSEPTQAYTDWVREMLGEYDEEEDEYEYDYDVGTPP